MTLRDIRNQRFVLQIHSVKHSEKANEFFICRTNYIKAKCPTEREKDFYDEDDVSDFDLNEN